jgi:hypothetical protein
MRPKLMTHLTPEMQAEVSQIREKADPSLIGEIENGGEVATPMDAVEYITYLRPFYRAEIGTRGGDYIYHFYPLEEQNFPPQFSDKMGDAFLEVFGIPERLEAAPVPDMNSWAVRAKGFFHPMSAGSNIPTRVLEVLDQKLER